MGKIFFRICDWEFPFGSLVPGRVEIRTPFFGPILLKPLDENWELAFPRSSASFTMKEPRSLVPEDFCENSRLCFLSGSNRPNRYTGEPAHLHVFESWIQPYRYRIGCSGQRIPRWQRDHRPSIADHECRRSQARSEGQSIPVS